MLEQVRSGFGVDYDIYARPQQALVSHGNAPLTPTDRLRLARCVVDDGWPLRRTAERFQVSHTIAARRAGRYRQWGAEGMHHRSSRPHHQPRRTPPAINTQVVRLRREQELFTPVQGRSPGSPVFTRRRTSR